jgi:hypothetical protein
MMEPSILMTEILPWKRWMYSNTSRMSTCSCSLVTLHLA